MFRPIKRAAKSSISEVIEEQRKLYGMVSPKELIEPETGSISNIGFSGVVGGTFDFLGLEDLIDLYIGKEGSHVKVNHGGITKALIMQLLHGPYQTLYGTSEFFARKPINVLLNRDIGAQDLNRDVLGRFLDDVYDFGSEKLFVLAAKQTAERLGIKITEAHLDSTSFSYDGVPKEEEMCELRIDYGYSRDHAPEKPQINLLGISDGQSRLPIFTKSVSGNIPDKTSFFTMLTDEWPMLSEQFKDLKYLVGDSAMCTERIMKEAQQKGIHVVTRVPDQYQAVKEIFAKVKSDDMEKIYPDDNDDENYGKWCDIKEIGGVPCKLLCVENRERADSKLATLERRAGKEQEKLQAAIKKLSTRPAKCRKDAEKLIDEIVAKCRLCKIIEITYEEVMGHSGRGRPKKDEPQEVISVKVTATVEIDRELIATKVQDEIKFVIATTDVDREWTMAELLSCYKRQSVIERTWKLSKNPTVLLNALYLKSPRRIEALMWLLSIALLVYSATEWRMRTKMKEKGLSMSTPDHRSFLAKPTLLRFKQYVDNSNINLKVIPEIQSIQISGVTAEFADIVSAMGFEWTRYYQRQTYEAFATSHSDWWDSQRIGLISSDQMNF